MVLWYTTHRLRVEGEPSRPGPGARHVVALGCIDCRVQCDFPSIIKGLPCVQFSNQETELAAAPTALLGPRALCVGPNALSSVGNGSPPLMSCLCYYTVGKKHQHWAELAPAHEWCSLCSCVSQHDIIHNRLWHIPCSNSRP